MDPCLAAVFGSVFLIILLIACAYYYLGVCGAGAVIIGLGLLTYEHNRAYSIENVMLKEKN